MNAPVPKPRPTVRDLFKDSLILGALGFGGGVSVLASIRNTAVTKRGWLTEREFDNTATIAQMLPGGAAANALACMGLRFHGVRGAAAGYFGFVLPGAVSILLLAWCYTRFGEIPHADAFLAGLNAAVVGIIIAITLRMLRTSVRRLWQMGVVATALLLSLAGSAGSLEVAFVGVGVGLAWDLGVERARLLRFRRTHWRAAPPVALPEEGKPLPSATRPEAKDAKDTKDAKGANGAKGEGQSNDTDKKIALLALPALGTLLPQFLRDLIPLSVVFFKTGLGAYGGGFAIIPSLHADLVSRGWLTERQFADAVAVGKLTPGPVLLMATFIGFVRDGLPGAIVATLSILAAPFGLVVVFATWLDRVRSRRWMRAALRGLTPAVVGLMMAAALTLGSTFHSGVGVAIAATVALTLVRFEQINPVALLALGGVARLALKIFLHL